jgi:hypothetical protein
MKYYPLEKVGFIFAKKKKKAKCNIIYMLKWVAFQMLLVMTSERQAHTDFPVHVPLQKLQG